MENRVLLSGLFVVVCFVADAYAFVVQDCKVAKGWASLERDDASSDIAIIDLNVDDIVLGQPFSFNFRLCQNGAEKPDRVTANATMPAHKHGMNYNPTVAFNADTGSFNIEDFVFHMPGEWEIAFSAYKGEMVSHYTKTVTVK